MEGEEIEIKGLNGKVGLYKVMYDEEKRDKPIFFQRICPQP